MIREQFPTPFDIKQTILFRTTPYETLRQFTQSLGIFCFGMGKKDMADFISNLLLDHQSYLSLRNIAIGAEGKTSISGFNLRHKLFETDKDVLYNDLVQLRSSINQQRDQLLKDGAPIPKLDMPKILNDKTLEVHFEYQRAIPGRVELIQKVESEVDFVLNKIGSTQWQVVCYPRANQDVKTIQTLFKQMAKRSYEVYTISLEPFSQQKRILFFDTLLQIYSKDKEWIFEEVTAITIRRPTKDHSAEILLQDEDFDGDKIIEDDIESVDRKYVESITQAILQGSNLRTNRFVKDCESEGFYFLAMTLKLANSSTAEVIEIMIRFKLSPQMFEVILMNMLERDDMGERPTVFKEPRQQQILQDFWNTAHLVWRQMYDSASRAPGKQMTFSDELENQELNVFNYEQTET